MNYFYKQLAIFRFIICFLFLTTHIYSQNDFCDHCGSQAHMSNEEPCLRCGRLVKDCDFSHTIRSLTYEDIINAPNSPALIDILFQIKGMHKSLWGRELSLHEIFKKSDEFCNQTGIKLPVTVQSGEK